MTSELSDEQKRANTIAAIAQSLNEQIALAASEGLKVQIDVVESMQRWTETRPISGGHDSTPVLIPVLRINVQVWKAM